MPYTGVISCCHPLVYNDNCGILRCVHLRVNAPRHFFWRPRSLGVKESVIRDAGDSTPVSNRTNYRDQTVSVPPGEFGTSDHTGEDVRAPAFDDIPPRKTPRTGKHPEVDEALRRWFPAVTSRGARMSGLLLEGKAKRFAGMLVVQDFAASNVENTSTR